MIKKLNYKEVHSEAGPGIWSEDYNDMDAIVKKINELVDAVNKVKK